MTHVSPWQGFSLHRLMTHLLTWHLAPVVKSLHCAAFSSWSSGWHYPPILGPGGRETKPSRVSCLRKEQARYKLLAVILWRPRHSDNGTPTFGSCAFLKLWLVIWVSLVTLTFTLTQIAKVIREGDAHITRVLGFGNGDGLNAGMPISL